MKTENLTIVAILIMVTFGVLFLFMSITPRFGTISNASDRFCRGQGFDYSPIISEYSEAFGKVGCISCYNRKCKSKEFSVTKDWMGFLHEVENVSDVLEVNQE